jgi:hypothetical protein
MPSRAPAWKFSSAVAKLICDQIGRSWSTSVRISP